MMDPPHDAVAPPPGRDSRQSQSWWLVDAAYAVLRLTASVFSTGLVAFRPIIPLFVCVVLMPLVVFLSVSAGWVVWKSAAVGWESSLHFQYGDGVPPYARISLPKIISQQRYDISVHLIIPAVDSNYDLGNFMTSLTLSTPANKTLISVRRPAIALPPPASFFSRKPRSITLNVHMLASYAFGTSKVIANVELGRRDTWSTLGNGAGREISVVSASIRGTVVHYGIRGLVTRFPFISSLLSAATFFVIVLLLLGVCILPTMLSPKSMESINISESLSVEDPVPALHGGSSSSDSDVKPVTRRTRLTKGTSRRNMVSIDPQSSTSPRKVEVNLRRRRSRLFERLSDSDS